ISTRNVSVCGVAPWSFEYQRQYDTVAPVWPAKLSAGLVRRVRPLSTSLSPIAPPIAPWPVTQQVVPGVGVWSSAGCAAVPFGLTRVQMPVVAVSPGPTVQPRFDSKLSSSRIGPNVESAEYVLV